MSSPTAAPTISNSTDPDSRSSDGLNVNSLSPIYMVPILVFILCCILPLVIYCQLNRREEEIKAAKGESIDSNKIDTENAQATEQTLVESGGNNASNTDNSMLKEHPEISDQTIVMTSNPLQGRRGSHNYRPRKTSMVMESIIANSKQLDTTLEKTMELAPQQHEELGVAGDEPYHYAPPPPPPPDPVQHRRVSQNYRPRKSSALSVQAHMASENTMESFPQQEELGVTGDEPYHYAPPPPPPPDPVQHRRVSQNYRPRKSSALSVQAHMASENTMESFPQQEELGVAGDEPYDAGILDSTETIEIAEQMYE